MIGSKLTSARTFHEAIDVLDAGIHRYGRVEALTQTMNVIELGAADDEFRAARARELEVPELNGFLGSLATNGCATWVGRTPRIVLLLLCACSPVDATEDVDRWSAALGNGDYAAARTGFRRVLERIDTNHPSFVRAKMGAIEAQIHIDPRHATYDFVDSARKGRQFGEREFCAFASKLVGAGHCDHGFTVLAEAAERFGRTERVTSTIEWVQRECDERAMRLLREHFY